jgi:hypothetical protein
VLSTVVTIVELPQAMIVTVDVGALLEPDPLILDALVRLQLAARRLGASIQLENACPELVDLLALVGLADVVPALGGSSVVIGGEVDREVEQRKEILVDEELGRADPPG